MYTCLIGLLFFTTGPTTTVQRGRSRPETRVSADDVKLSVDLVVVDAEVLQRKTARVVGDLKVEDFSLYEDGTKQQLLQFSQDTLPLSVVLLVDRGWCLDPLNNEVSRATLDALSRLGPRDEVALMTFASGVQLVSGFSNDRKAIAGGLQNLPPREKYAGHCFYKAFYEAARFMREATSPAGRRVIIMITADPLAENSHCSPPEPKEARDEVFEAGAVVCGLIPIIGNRPVSQNSTFLTHAYGPQVSALAQLAEETGGDVFSSTAVELHGAFGKLIDQLRNRYILAFVSSNTKHDGKFRKLKVELSSEVKKREGDVVVRTRRGYVAPNPIQPRTEYL